MDEAEVGSCLAFAYAMTLSSPNRWVKAYVFLLLPLFGTNFCLHMSPGPSSASHC